MSAITTMKTATPADMVHAWVEAVMYGHSTHADHELVAHPPVGVADPTFYREGWRSASSIKNVNAIYAIRGYLAHRGLVAPVETEAAWERTEARGRVRAPVREVMTHALDEFDERARKAGTVPTVREYAAAVIEALQDLED